jgi:LPS-assembly lipoprotein
MNFFGNVFIVSTKNYSDKFNHAITNILLTIILSLVCSCSLRPLYNQEEIANYGHHLGQIEIQPIESIEGVEFYNKMSSILAPARDKKYLLKITLLYSSNHSSIQKNSDITRENEKLLVEYTLTNKETGKILTNGTFRKFSSYSTIFTPYANNIRSQNTKHNLATTAAEEIRNRLILFFGSTAR